MKETMELTDLYEVASLLCVGAELINLKVIDKGVALFEVAADDLHKLDNEYINGKIFINALDLKEKLNLLRDLMFKKIREYQSKTILEIGGRR